MPTLITLLCTQLLDIYIRLMDIITDYDVLHLCSYKKIKVTCGSTVCCE